MSVKNKKPGGQPGPRKKATVEEEELRIRVVLELIAEGRPRGEIKKMVSSQFGTSPRSIERYLTKAHIRLREETGKSIGELRSESFAFYLSIIRNSQASLSDKLKARQRIDKLLGVDVPQQHGPVELILPSNAEGENKDARQAVAQLRSFYGLRDRETPESRSLAAGETAKSA